MADNPERFARALPPPAGPLCRIDDALIERAVTHARNSPRRRVIQPFHPSDADPLHRMLNAMQPDTYARPHRHLDPPKAEAWVLLRGAVAFFTFHDDGTVDAIVRLGLPGDPVGVDLQPGIFHTLLALQPDSVIYEVKTGPYTAATDKTFAPWAPPEGDPAVPAYQAGLRAAFHRAYPG